MSDLTLYAYPPGATPSDATGKPLFEGADGIDAGSAIVARLPEGLMAVAFSLDGAWVKIESSPPYSLGGDERGRLNGVPALTSGDHFLSAVACRDAADARAVAEGREVEGLVGTTVRFRVGPPVPSLQLLAFRPGADPGADAPVTVLADGVSVPAGCGAAAIDLPAGTGAVAFRLDGRAGEGWDIVQASAPYCFPGDAGGRIAGSEHLTPGPHVLDIWACPNVMAAGAALAGEATPTISVTFTCYVPDVVVDPRPGPLAGPAQWRRPVDAEGYVLLPAGADPVHVAADGDDADPGTAERPVCTLAGADARLRSERARGVRRLGLRLRRGDAFDGPLRLDGTHGGTPEAPFIVAAYGVGRRPRLKAPADLVTINGPQWLVLQSLAFYPPDWGDRALDSTGGGGLWVEDCAWRNWARPVVIKGCDGWVFRRNVVADAFYRGAEPDDPVRKSIGLYAERCTGPLWLEGNAFERVGWMPGQAPPSIYNQAVYVQENCRGELVATGNLFSRVSSHGLQARPGGLVRANLFVECRTGLSLGLVNGEHQPVTGGVEGDVGGNYFAGCAIQCIEVDNVRRLLVEGNAFQDSPVAINFHPSLTGPSEARVRQSSVGVLEAIVRRNRSGKGGGLRRGEVRPCRVLEDANDWNADTLEPLPADLIAHARAMAPGEFCDLARFAANLVAGASAE